MSTPRTCHGVLAASVAVVACGAALCLGAGDETLYETSFERFEAARIRTVTDGPVTWTARGESEVLERFHRTGGRSLHIFGGEGNVLEVRLAGHARSAKGLRFHAERWTRRSPFRFRVEAETGGRWREVGDLDDIVIVRRGFPSKVVLKLPRRDVTALRFTVTAPANAGVLIDDLALLKDEPMEVSEPPRVAAEPIRNLLASTDLFVSGTQGTHTFRIPALVTAANGDLIAACDARRRSSRDLIWERDIDIVVRRSSDNGETWSDMEVVCDYGDGRPASDPSLVLDRSTGEIFCFYNYMDQDNAPKEFRLYVQTSRDDGRTWGKARDITDEIARPEWKMDFKFITSGRGIQRRSGELVHTLVNLQQGLHLFGSPDHGKTWRLFDVPIKPANESKVVELEGRELMVNSRVNGRRCRWEHRSTDDGASWRSAARPDLVDPGCNGSIIRYTSRADGYAKDRLLFSNASSPSGRKNLAVRLSYDEGATWTGGKLIDAGPSAYSSLTVCRDGSIGVLYEPGHRAVRFARFTLSDLTDGRDELSKPYEPGRGGVEGGAVSSRGDSLARRPPRP
ncbi:MAG: sialidase family protein [Planctomycetota bacterium]